MIALYKLKGVRMASSAAQTKATVKYIKEKQTTFVFRCHNERDADMIAFLKSQPNVSGFLKGLVREKMQESL